MADFTSYKSCTTKTEFEEMMKGNVGMDFVGYYKENELLYLSDEAARLARELRALEKVADECGIDITQR
ncbi:hypothetical protein NDU88_001647 [Pleurodeles waltl]|uniref:Uncharacterized protein n=1 Tax=Pleurodeles waltl TaxID=8319 RepID=A0AAV7T090_PLEWA|nr:hypothetical protein NDU88_001647 [Pleurodeles waltl]